MTTNGYSTTDGNSMPALPALDGRQSARGASAEGRAGGVGVSGSAAGASLGAGSDALPLPATAFLDLDGAAVAAFGLNLSAAALRQNRRPVGGGPSLKTW